MADAVVQRFTSYNNHFTSLVEPVNTVIQTAFYWDHRYTDLFVDIVNIKTTPMWAELLHDNNVANGFDFSYKNSCLLGYLLFKDCDFGYENVKANIGNTLMKVLSRQFVQNRLRSIKHELLKI